MAITYRLVKGSALTWTELDNNFTDLDGRVTTNASDIANKPDALAGTLGNYARFDASGDLVNGGVETWDFALSDETTALTTGTKLTWRTPYAITVTDVRASVTTAPTGAALAIDMQEGGVTIFSTTLTIDVSEKTSTTAAIPAVISDASLADDAEMTFIIDTVGSTVAGAGLKIKIYGYKT